MTNFVPARPALLPARPARPVRVRPGSVRAWPAPALPALPAGAGWLLVAPPAAAARLGHGPLVFCPAHARAAALGGRPWGGVLLVPLPGGAAECESCAEF